MSRYTSLPKEISAANWPAISDPSSLVDTWRQLHYAAQAASEIGKGWGDPAADDSHSALVWENGALRSVRIGGSIFATLEFVPFQIRVGESALALEGRTPEEVLVWVRGRAEEGLGPARQAADPAPDLPEHELGSGSAFAVVDPRAFGVLRDLYSAADKTLRMISATLPDRPEVLCWPHHFDIAALHVLSRDESGAMLGTIGVGLAVPDELEPEGYVYASGWSRDGVINAAELPNGTRWEGTMGVFALSGLAEPGGGARVAAFLNHAFGALNEAFAR